MSIGSSSEVGVFVIIDDEDGVVAAEMFPKDE